MSLAALLGAGLAYAARFLSRSRQRWRAAEEDANQAAVARLRQALDRTDGSDAVAHTREEIERVERELKKRAQDRRLSAFTQRPRVLGVSRHVFIPGASLVLAATSAAAAKALADVVIFDTVDIGSLVAWMVSLVALGVGIWRTTALLKVDEYDYDAVDDAYLSSQLDAFKQGVAEKEAEVRPIVQVECLERVPLTIPQRQWCNIRFRLTITPGHTVHRARFVVFHPPGFQSSVPTSKSGVEGASYEGWTKLELLNRDLITGTDVIEVTVPVYPPDRLGDYRIGYAFVSEEYSFDTFRDLGRELAVTVVSIAGSADAANTA